MRSNLRPARILWAALLPAAFGTGTAHAACADLMKLQVKDTTITLAESVAKGAFKAPPGGAGPPVPESTWAQLPGFCRVAGIVKPTSDSEIRFEVWMPQENWNAKFVGIGNGVWAGSISYSGMAEPLAAGYSTASTDTGHQGNPLDAGFAVGHPEKLRDFAHRAIHEMTRVAKESISAFYGKRTSRSLFVSCSTGGRQGLMAAHRYPQDYDGISAMAPANPMVPLMVGSLWTGYAALKDDASRISPAKWSVVHKAAVASCDAQDGVKDGIIGSPKSCRFDPATLQCKDADTADCLTAPQVSAVRAIYAGTKNPRTGEQIYPGFAIGSEPMLPILTSGPEPFPVATTYLRGLVFKDPKWDFRTFDYDKDVVRAKEAGAELDVPPNGLAPYFEGGRKLLLTHGWADGLIPAQSTIDFYQSLTANLGREKSGNGVRLFMAPGMGHCAGGEGPSAMDLVSVIDDWVATGKAPERIVASNPPGAPKRTRPLCPYPQEAVYSGRGSTDSEESFRCEAPKP
jgi:feruloyl esterase